MQWLELVEKIATHTRNLKWLIIHVKRKCRELTTGGWFICPITAVFKVVTHPRGRDALPFIAAELVQGACMIGYGTQVQRTSMKMSLSLSLSHSSTGFLLCTQLTAEERVFIAVVSTVVIPVTQALGVDADVGVVTLDLAFRTRPVSWKEKR